MPRPARLIAANWKMNGLRADGGALAADLARRAGTFLQDVGVVLCPPATLLGDVGAAVAGSSIALGAQDCSTAEKGAYTGDLSAAMLADQGCRYVIVGHSERRGYHHESDAQIAEKCARAQTAGLRAIVCVGESAAQKDAGQTLATVEAQIAASLPDACVPAKLVIAYEPIWAIGTGRIPQLNEIAEVAGALRLRLNARFGEAGKSVSLLYGGSVTAANASQVLAVANVDGALVGGASLKADEFWAIVTASKGLA